MSWCGGGSQVRWSGALVWCCREQTNSVEDCSIIRAWKRYVAVDAMTTSLSTSHPYLHTTCVSTPRPCQRQAPVYVTSMFTKLRRCPRHVCFHRASSLSSPRLRPQSCIAVHPSSASTELRPCLRHVRTPNYTHNRPRQTIRN